jgi:predicted metal-dependent HD superfamily phosphohydrolase
MYEHWRDAWTALDVPEPPKAVYEDVVARHQESHRHYHTLVHLEECLVLLRELAGTARHPEEIALALWYHDVIYEPLSASNEADSADLARQAALAAGVGTESADRIHALVLATRHHALPTDADQALIMDIDLAILGAAPERFDEYERQVQAEYAAVPEGLFRRGRREILVGFLARERIFLTPECHARFEDAARVNLRRSVSALKG